MVTAKQVKIILLISLILFFSSIVSLLVLVNAKASESYTYICLISSVVFIIVTIITVFIIIRKENTRNLESTLKDINDKAELSNSSALSDEEIINGNSEVKQDVKIMDNLPDLENCSDLEDYINKTFTAVSRSVELGQGLFFLYDSDDKSFKLKGKYAVPKDSSITDFKFGEGLAGQVADNGVSIVTDDIPDDMNSIICGLGSGQAKYLAIIPIIHEGKTICVFELFSFHPFDEKFQAQFCEISEQIASGIYKYISD